jgi:hypothetical protein
VVHPSQKMLSAIPISMEIHCEGELLDRSPRKIYTVVDPVLHDDVLPRRYHVGVMTLEKLYEDSHTSSVFV